jgi:hypothetical protein
MVYDPWHVITHTMNERAHMHGGLHLVNHSKYFHHIRYVMDGYEKNRRVSVFSPLEAL